MNWFTTNLKAGNGCVHAGLHIIYLLSYLVRRNYLIQDFLGLEGVDFLELSFQVPC